MEMIGKVLGNRYEIQEKIGSGGMATVYKAKCRLLNRKVAIKILRDEFSNDAEFIKRFQVEAQSAASLSHTNIVSIYDVGEEDGMHYIVMELVEGKTLKEIIKENGRLEWKDAVKIASQIASGLEQAHKNHIVHRDIKPHNIIITKDGIAKVTDFGIAKAVSNSTINAFGSTIGSVHYFSPEHARGGYTDEKSDIYSLGVVLYEMVTGRLPFDADTPVTIALKHLQETPVEPISIVPNIPEALNEIILKAMQKDVNSRYTTATAMNSDLQKVLKSPATVGKILTKENKDCPTQKVPIVGVNLIDKDELTVNLNSKTKKEKMEEMGNSKKKITKKQAIMKLIMYIFLSIALVFVSAAITIKIINGSNIFGSKNVEVPSLLGYTEAQATETLSQLGLKLEVLSRVINEEYESGQICYQNYTEVKAGGTVGVRISKGSAEMTLVPNVIELSAIAAKTKIEQNNLVCVEQEEASTDVKEGYVVRQEPEFNTEVAENSIVTIYVSTGEIEGMVETPNVLGDTEEVARKKIIDANLVPSVQYIEDESKEEGVVISQTPESGISVSELTEVVIIINKIDKTSENNPGSENNTSDPTENTNQNETQTVTINLSDKGSRPTFEVRVEIIGEFSGKKILYEGTHSRSDGSIQVDVPKGITGLLRVYIDDELVTENAI